MSTRSQLTKDLNGKLNGEKGKMVFTYKRKIRSGDCMFRFFFSFDVMTQHQTTHLDVILTWNLNVSLNQRRYPWNWELVITKKNFLWKKNFVRLKWFAWQNKTRVSLGWHNTKVLRVWNWLVYQFWDVQLFVSLAGVYYVYR